MSSDYSSEDDDPNEIENDFRPPNSSKGPIHTKLSVEELRELLESEPDVYKRCRISTNAVGMGEATPLDDEGLPILLSNRKSQGRAFDGDEVVVKIIHHGNRKERYGSVEGITKRDYEIKEKKFVCRRDEANPQYMIPVDEKVTKFYINYRNRNGYRPGGSKQGGSHRKEADLFVVQYVNWSQYNWYPQGKIVETRNFSTNGISLIKEMCDIPGNFERDIESAAEKLIKPAIYRNETPRQNMTHLEVITIDPEFTSKHDDGLSVESCHEHNDCWIIGIHIADVASVIPSEDPVDLEAKKRGVSYDDKNNKSLESASIFPRCVIDGLSLNLNKTRDAVSLFVHSSVPVLKRKEGKNDIKRGSYKLMKTTVKVHHNLTYKDANTNIKKNLNGSCLHTYGVSNILYNLWKTMWAFRYQRLGLAAFYHQKFASPCEIETSLSSLCVEEAMIMYNACAAHYLRHKNCQFIARVMERPSCGDVRSWLSSSSSIYQQSCKECLSPGCSISCNGTEVQILQTTLDEIKQALHDNDIETAVFLACCDDNIKTFIPSLNSYREMMKKVEHRDTGNSGGTEHFDLRLPIYTQCTSPLRVYSQLEIQRQIIAVLRVEHENVMLEKEKQSRRQIVLPYVPPTRSLPTVVFGSPVRRVYQSPSQSVSTESDSDDGSYYEEDGDSQASTEISCSSLYEPVDLNYHIRMERKLQTFRSLILNHNLMKKLRQKPAIFTAVIIQVTETSLKFSIFGGINIYDPQFNSININHLKYKLKEKGKAFTWKFRYYDMKDDDVNNYTTTCKLLEVSVKTWTDFTSCLAEEYSREVKQKLQKIVEEATPSNLLTQNKSGSCTKETARCKKKCNCPDKMFYQTPNKLWHGREIKLEAKSGSLLEFQVSQGIERGISSPVIQLLNLAPDLDVCLSHQRHITMFDFEYTYDTPLQPELESYFRKWIALVQKEALYSAVKSNQSIILQNLDVEIKKTPRGTLVGSFDLELERMKHSFFDVRQGDYLCLRGKKSKQDTTSWVAHAVVTKSKKPVNPNVKFQQVEFEICPSVGTSKPPKLKLCLTCEVIPLSVSHRRMIDALKIVCGSDDPIFQNICEGNIDNDPDGKFDVENLLHEVDHVQIPGFPYRLNEVQAKEVKNAMKNQFTLIQGPPGTGKSYMGAQLAYFLWKSNGQLNKKILYCGPSNKSVDVVAGYLKDVVGPKVIRVYGAYQEEKDFPIPIKPFINYTDCAMPDASIQEITLHHVIRQPGKPFALKLRQFDNMFKKENARLHNWDQTEWYKKYTEYKDILREAKAEEIKTCDVILCTCILSGGPLVSTQEYAQCIVDECGMCSEPETLVPIVASHSEKTQIILIGDHKQLDPIVVCKEARMGGLGVSMFERLQMFANPLVVQYRMNPVICKFSSDQFYGGKLENDEKVKCFKGCGRFLKIPAFFVHVDGTEQEEEESKSKYNQDEIKTVVAMLDELHEDDVSPSNIMVLSPYLAQCARIRKYLHEGEHELQDVHVGTVVTSQGEFLLIFVSFILFFVGEVLVKSLDLGQIYS
uniref:helicase with zinc finger domain 2-like isoform X2 n=1 Tax=Ciona intestinalis TaxID=7719 RepID=UPI000EF4D89D|nr:helicase with zinc finger domain 2-like isoform X2 [Ciona intestinalis]|eukprot:XP_026693898.1 helicase with zinc finger domain 2-like isoform X2 [Ciona intestinalis]